MEVKILEKRLLFIDIKETFISRAMMDDMKNHGFDVEFCVADISKISKKNIPDLIFINVEESLKENAELFVYLKDICVEGDKLLFLAGYTSDITEITSKMPESIIGGTFERPVNTKTVGETIDARINGSAVSIGKRHILVVDDSGESLRAIKGWLSDRYNVSMVNSAANAIAFLATNKPDLILLDYEMPVCSGPQLLEMIRAESGTSSIPVIFLTSKDDRESVAKVLALKPQGYLLKTLKPDQIVSSIDEFFQLEKAKQQ